MGRLHALVKTQETFLPAQHSNAQRACERPIMHSTYDLDAVDRNFWPRQQRHSLIYRQCVVVLTSTVTKQIDLSGVADKLRDAIYRWIQYSVYVHDYQSRLCTAFALQCLQSVA